MNVYPYGRYLHKKSGHIVRVLGLGKLQTAKPCIGGLKDMEVMVAYEHEGNLWIRSLAEFSDGRFEEVSNGAKEPT